MARVGVVKGYANTLRDGVSVQDVVLDLGGSFLVTCDAFNSVGDRSLPLVGDYAAVIRMPGEDRYSIVGYWDNAEGQSTSPGEKHIYARDSIGAVKSEIIMYDTGQVSVTNDAGGGITMLPNGDVVINGVTITASGSVQAQSIVADGKELVDHDHDILSGSSAPGPTGANN